jgi:hypothetical protein
MERCTMPNLTYRSDDAAFDEWLADVEKFANEQRGDETVPAAPSNFKVEGKEKAVFGTFDAIDQLGVTEYAVYRSDSTIFDLSGPTSLIETKLQPPDPATDSVTFTDPEGTEDHYYFARGIKGNRVPKLQGTLSESRNTKDLDRSRVVPRKVTGATVTITELVDVQDVRRSSLSFGFTKPDPLDTFQLVEIWMVGYQEGRNPVLAFSGEESPFIRTLNVTEETVAFLFVSANAVSRRKVILAEGTFDGVDGTTNKLYDAGGQFKDLGILPGTVTASSTNTAGTGDLVLNTTNGALFYITAVDEEGELSLTYIADTPLSTSEGDFDNGDSYRILQGPWVTEKLHSTNNDTTVVDPATDISMDVDVLEVDLVNKTNTILVGAQATANADTVSEVTIQGAPRINGVAPSFSASTGFSSPDINEVGPHPLVFTHKVSAQANWQFTAKIKNHFGYGNWLTPIDFSPTITPTDAEASIPELDEFHIDPGATGTPSGKATFKLGANNQSTFMISLQGSKTKIFPVETVLKSEADATLTATRGSLTVSFSGFTATLNAYAGKVLYFGQRNSAAGGDDGYDNLANDEHLAAWEIVSNTAGNPWTAVLKGQFNGVTNDGDLTKWSIVDSPIWALVDYYEDIIIDNSGSQWTNFNNINVQDHFFEIGPDFRDGVYFRAAALNVRGQGNYRYSTAAAAGSETQGHATINATPGITAWAIRTTDSGARVEINDTDGLQAIDSGGVIRCQIPLVGTNITFRDSADTAVGNMTAYPVDHIAIHPEAHNASSFSLGYTGLLYENIFLNAHDFMDLNVRHTTNGLTGLAIDGASATVPAVQIRVKGTTMGAWTEAGLDVKDDLEVDGDIDLAGDLNGTSDSVLIGRHKLRKLISSTWSAGDIGADEIVFEWTSGGGAYLLIKENVTVWEVALAAR